MPNDPRLAGLVRISTLVKDMNLAALRKAEAERMALLDRIATLSESPSPPAELPPAVAVEVVMRYERWAELRRREIEAALVRKSQECEVLKARARLSVGRDGVLAKLVARSSD